MVREKAGYFLALLCGVVVLMQATFAVAQAPVRSADMTAIAEDLNSVANEMSREEVAAEDAWYDRHELALSSDGNLPGNLRVFDDSGKLIPARVKLYFLQEGKVVVQTTPNQDGDFQAVGLRSGSYSLVAAGQSGFAAMSVRILPPPERPSAPKANTIGRIREISNQPGFGLHLNISIIPAVDVQPAFSLAVQSNAGGLGSLPGVSALGGAAAAPAPVAAGAFGAAGGAAGGAAIGGAGGLFATGAAIAGVAAASNNNQSSNSTSSGTTASPNGSN